MEVVLEAIKLGTAFPSSTLMKWWCFFCFFLSFQTNNWRFAVSVTPYWLPLFPKQELMNMFVTAIFTKIVLSFFF